MIRSLATHPNTWRAGLALSMMAGAAWAAGRLISERLGSRLINWDWAAQVAASASRARTPDVHWDRRKAQQRYSDLVHRSHDLVSSYTGVTLPEPLTNVRIFDRMEWVDANIANFRLLFDSLEQGYQSALKRTSASGALSGLSQVVLSAEVGLLLGYLARRVLGQYDISLLGRKPINSGQVYFVEPNIGRFERRYALPSDDLRFWIALHEVTHAFEFEAHPWLREHLNGLLTTYLGSLARDLFGSRQDLPLAALLGRIRANLVQSQHPLELMMSDEQRGIFWSLQALMALMEGYSNHVMQQVGQQFLPSYGRLRLYFEERARRRGTAEQLFIRLTGLDLKLEQYALGEHFVNTVVKARGIEVMNRVWDGPAMLPSLNEIKAPLSWLDRIEAGSTAASTVIPS
ncbi:MAG: hypothetical protein CL878_00470 [Dehalococcoidia bacterium]|nr:hypothetical protein [Dehalococcoidia bacterium]